MSRLPIQFLDQGLHRVLFDAMPVPAFVVDEDVNILECNKAAIRLFEQGQATAGPRKAGDVLHCLHITDSPNGCGGAAACSTCGLRETVQAAARGKSVTRQWAEMDLIRKGKPARINLRISCQPFTFGKSSFILLVLEGLEN